MCNNLKQVIHNGHVCMCVSFNNRLDLISSKTYVTNVMVAASYNGNALVTNNHTLASNWFEHQI